MDHRRRGGRGRVLRHRDHRRPDHPAAQHYQAVGYPFGPSLATSQVLGGGIIWILGDAVGLPFLAVQLIQMMREDKVEAAEIDAELDARDAARAAARAQQAATASASRPPVAATAAAAAATTDGASAEYDAVITRRRCR